MEEQDMEQLKKERDEYLDGWKRAKADFINYKKEEESRARGFTFFVREQMLKSLLPTIESMERAKAELSEKEKTDPMYFGFLQTYSQLEKFLKDQGFKEIDASGEFNPEFHEIVVEEEREGAKSGEIIGVLEKGYMLNGNVIKASKVKIAK